jgi:hypothetical protein
MRKSHILIVTSIIAAFAQIAPVSVSASAVPQAEPAMSVLKCGKARRGYPVAPPFKAGALDTKVMPVILKEAGSTSVVELPVKAYLGKAEVTVTWSEKKLSAAPCTIVMAAYEKGKLVHVSAMSPSETSLRAHKGTWVRQKVVMRMFAVMTPDLAARLNSMRK